MAKLYKVPVKMAEREIALISVFSIIKLFRLYTLKVLGSLHQKVGFLVPNETSSFN